MKQKFYPAKAVLSFLLVLFLMPLGHAAMILMEKFMDPAVLHFCAFMLGAVGVVITVAGIFIKGDTKQTLAGLIGGLLFWTGWVEFLLMYYARRFQTMCELENGQLMDFNQAVAQNMDIATKPEYLILPSTFGFWAMFMLFYLFCIPTGCNFINWCQRVLFGSKKQKIVAKPIVRHTSLVTFLEFNMIIWTSYLLLMFLYDDNFFGERHWFTLSVGVACLVGAFFIFKKQLHLSSWGANIRMAIATVIVFWTPVEILGRLNFFKEIWVHPEQYKQEMITILLAFIAVAAIVIMNGIVVKGGKKQNTQQ
ncbi:MAG: hypothetical protein IJ250_01835 [Bacteroidales bacterium]|nr:hypothetical protein [Bacteroidales bacterium]